MNANPIFPNGSLEKPVHRQNPRLPKLFNSATIALSRVRKAPKSDIVATVFKYSLVRDLEIRRLTLAAACMNGRSFRCTAAPNFSLSRQSQCCESARREIAMTAMGSKQSFAAYSAKVRIGNFELVEAHLEAFEMLKLVF